MDKKLIDTLEIASKLETEDDFKLFSETLEKIVVSKDSAYIVNILMYLQDAPIFIEAMDNIISAAESFPDEEYVQSVINITPCLQEKSAFWLNILYCRLFNSSSHLEIYKERYKKLEKNIQTEITHYLINIFLKNQPNKEKIIRYITTL